MGKSKGCGLCKEGFCRCKNQEFIARCEETMDKADKIIEDNKWPPIHVEARGCDPFQHGEKKFVSDGSTANYYELPKGAKELQEIIAYKNMNAQLGEIFRACMRYGEVEHSPKIRDIKKIIFYAQEELKRLERYEHNK